MARPLRRYRPGTTWHVTTRTLEERFLISLDPAVVSAIGACLAKAASSYFVHVHSFMQMQNHLHLIVTLSRPNLHHFMRSFLSAAAKIINAHLGRQGKVFGERARSGTVQSWIARSCTPSVVVSEPALAEPRAWVAAPPGCWYDPPAVRTAPETEWTTSPS